MHIFIMLFIHVEHMLDIDTDIEVEIKIQIVQTNKEFYHFDLKLCV